MFKKLLSITAVVLSLCAMPSHAAFIDTDWKTESDKKSTLDTDTGIEWLKLTQTLGSSVSDIIARLDTDLKGWRFPTASEVSALVDKIWGSSIVRNVEQRYSYNASIYAIQSQLQAVLGKTATLSGDQYATYGYVYSGGVYMTGARKGLYFGVPSVSRYELQASATHHLNSRNQYFGVYLVNDGGVTLSSIQDPSINANNPNSPVNQVPTDVSTPIGFVFLGWLCLAVMRRRQFTV